MAPLMDMGPIVAAEDTGSYTLIRRAAGAYDPATGTFSDPTEVESTIQAQVVPNANVADDEIPTAAGAISTDRIQVIVAADQLGGVALACTDVVGETLADRLLYQGKTYLAINTLDYIESGGFSVAQFAALSKEMEGTA